MLMERRNESRCFEYPKSPKKISLMGRKRISDFFEKLQTYNFVVLNCVCNDAIILSICLYKLITLSSKFFNP